MSLKSRLGLDAFDLALQAAVTVVVILWISATNNEHDAFVGYGVVTTSSLVLLGVRRHFALRRQGRQSLSTGEMAAERIAELEQRVAELELDQARIAELEERLDFAERLLAAGKEPARELAP
jgi:hypothetical protein